MLLHSIAKAIPAITFQMNLGHSQKVDFKLLDYSSDTYMNYSNAKTALSMPGLENVVMAPSMHKLGAIQGKAIGIIAIDSDREDKFKFDDGLMKIGPGECILSEQAARTFKVVAGESFSFDIYDSLLEEYLGSLVVIEHGVKHRPYPSKYKIKMKVIQVLHQADYVHRINTQLPFNIFVDISSFLSYAAAFRSKAIKNETVFNAYMAKQNMIEYCSSLKFKLGDQNDIYNHADTSSTKRAFNKVLSKLEIAFNLGENRITRKIDLFSKLIDKEAMMSLLNCMLAVVFVSLTMLSAFVISSLFSSMMLDR